MNGAAMCMHSMKRNQSEVCFCEGFAALGISEYCRIGEEGKDDNGVVWYKNLPKINPFRKRRQPLRSMHILTPKKAIYLI